jgi:predicted RNA-binding protein YlqC (UPF0109 family)
MGDKGKKDKGKREKRKKANQTPKQKRKQKRAVQGDIRESDLGKVIGKKGRTASAKRTILNAVSVKNRKKVVLEIMD